MTAKAAPDTATATPTRSALERIRGQVGAWRDRAKARDACRGELEAIEARITALEAERDAHATAAAKAKKAARAFQAEAGATSSPAAVAEREAALTAQRQEESAAEVVSAALTPLYEDRGALRRNFSGLEADTAALDAVISETLRETPLAELIAPHEAALAVLVDEVERVAAKHWPKIEGALQEIAPVLAEYTARGGVVQLTYGMASADPSAVLARVFRALGPRLDKAGYGKVNYLTEAQRARR